MPNNKLGRLVNKSKSSSLTFFIKMAKTHFWEKLKKEYFLL